MNRYLFILLSFFLLKAFNSFSQVSCEKLLNKKDDILIKTNQNTAAYLENLEWENDLLLQGFVSRKLHIQMQRGNVKNVVDLENKAKSIVEMSVLLISDLLEEMNTIAQLADVSQSDYVYRGGYNRRAKTLRPVEEIKNWDNRVIPTKRLLGNDIKNPKPEKIHIENKLKEFKDEVLKILANYSDEKNTYFYKPSESEFNYDNESNINPNDEYSLKKIYDLLPLNEVTHILDRETNKKQSVPWLVDNFLYSSVLETAVIINQVILKIKLVEKEALDFLLNKIDAPRFNYNKIETFTVQGKETSNEKLVIKFVVAAIDTTAKYEHRYSFDKDKPKNEWKEVKGEMVLKKEDIKTHSKVYGETKIHIRGMPTWIPWIHNLRE